MKKKFLALSMAACLMVGLAPRALAGGSIFEDVPEEHWAVGYIGYAYMREWVDGIGGGLFAPNRTLSEAEFLTMTVRAMFPETLEKVSVTDSKWYAPYWPRPWPRGWTPAPDWQRRRTCSVRSPATTWPRSSPTPPRPRA